MPEPVPIPATAPPAAAPRPPRPGDVILARVIKWWTSGQVQRAATGILASAAPVLYDLFGAGTLTWKTGLNALVLGLFTWMGWSRLKSPDIATGTKAFDAPVHPVNVTAFAPAQLMADLQAREGATVVPPKGDPK
jgi:hypothetical protein